MNDSNKNIPKHRGKLQALDHMSLGISIVVAILMGVGLGLLLKNWTGEIWTLWIGVLWGIAAAILNIKKAYNQSQKELKELSDDPKYQYAMKHGVGYREDDD